MASSGSAKPELSPNLSYAGQGKQRHYAGAEVGIRLQSSLSVSTERHQGFATPADSVLHRFRLVRQQDQVIQNERQHRLGQLQTSATAHHRTASPQVNIAIAALVKRSSLTLPPSLTKDAGMLADRARSINHGHHEVDSMRQGSKVLSRPATTAAVGHAGRLSTQQWAPAPCSIACTSYRQSLPPHATVHPVQQAITGAQKVHAHSTPQTCLSRRMAYGEVLRRVRSAHKTSAAHQPSMQHGTDCLQPWSN